MKQKILYTVAILALLGLGVLAGVQLTNYQTNKAYDTAFNAGNVVSEELKSGKSADVYKAALGDYTATTTAEEFDAAMKPFANPELIKGESTLYSDTGSGYVFIQEFTNDKYEYKGQITIALLKDDNGSLVVSNIIPNLQ